MSGVWKANREQSNCRRNFVYNFWQGIKTIIILRPGTVSPVSLMRKVIHAEDVMRVMELWWGVHVRGFALKRGVYEMRRQKYRVADLTEFAIHINLRFFLPNLSLFQFPNYMVEQKKSIHFYQMCAQKQNARSGVNISIGKHSFV